MMLGRSKYGHMCGWPLGNELSEHRDSVVVDDLLLAVNESLCRSPGSAVVSWYFVEFGLDTISTRPATWGCWHVQSNKERVRSAYLMEGQSDLRAYETCRPIVNIKIDFKYHPSFDPFGFLLLVGCCCCWLVLVVGFYSL